LYQLGWRSDQEWRFLDALISSFGKPDEQAAIDIFGKSNAPHAPKSSLDMLFRRCRNQGQSFEIVDALH
jgi:hypothetical protein